MIDFNNESHVKRLSPVSDMYFNLLSFHLHEIKTILKYYTVCWLHDCEIIKWL